MSSARTRSRLVAEVVGHAEADPGLRLTGVLTALDAELMPTDVCRGELLSEAALPESVRGTAPPARRLAASLDWTPEHGDRDTTG